MPPSKSFDWMPAGVSWPKYIAFVTSSFVSMLAGAQVVHNIYEPLKDLPEYVEREKTRLRRLEQEALQND